MVGGQFKPVSLSRFCTLIKYKKQLRLLVPCSKGQKADPAKENPLSTNSQVMTGQSRAIRFHYGYVCLTGFAEVNLLLSSNPQVSRE